MSEWILITFNFINLKCELTEKVYDIIIRIFVWFEFFNIHLLKFKFWIIIIIQLNRLNEWNFRLGLIFFLFFFIFNLHKINSVNEIDDERALLALTNIIYIYLFIVIIIIIIIEVVYFSFIQYKIKKFVQFL